MRIGPASLSLVALARNRSSPARQIAALRVADLEIDALDLRIRHGSSELRLSPSEHVVLYVLAAKPGTVIPYRVLAEALGLGSRVRTNTIARHVATLRRKLGDDAEDPRYIETVPGVGYRFAARRAS